MHSKQILKKELTFFRKPISNVKELKLVHLYQIYLLIKSDKYKKITTSLRKLSDKSAKGNYKSREFDYVLWSGLFNIRNNSGLVKHSGLGVIDLDGIPSDEIEELRKRLCSNEQNLQHLLLLFTSPSGNGLKLVYLIDIESHSHTDNIRGLCNFLYKELKVNIEYIDISGKDVARACFLPHDPNIFINPKIL